MNTTVVLLRAAESDLLGRSLTEPGVLQVGRFAELMQTRRLSFDRILVAANEADSWLTAARVKELISEDAGITFLRQLPLPLRATYLDNVVALIMANPDTPLSSYKNHPGYEALRFHVVHALCEIKQQFSHNCPQRILICSRHSHVLSLIAFLWVNEMVLRGFRLRRSDHLPLFSITGEDIFHAATEYFLWPGQGFMLRYDASDPTMHMVDAIQYLNPEIELRPAD